MKPKGFTEKALRFFPCERFIIKRRHCGAATTEFLERFFENLLLGKNNELKNRFLHIDFQSRNAELSKSQTATLNCDFEELAIIKVLSAFPDITQKGLAEKTGISVGTIKRRTVSLQGKGYIRRLNGKRNGKWEILVDFE